MDGRCLAAGYVVLIRYLYSEFNTFKTALKGVSNLRFGVLNPSGLINSKFAQFYINERYKAASYNGGVNFTVDMINSLPVPDFDLSDKNKQSEHNIIIETVKKIISAKEKDPKAGTSKQEEEIDNIVYKLYGLSETEISLIENI